MAGIARQLIPLASIVVVVASGCARPDVTPHMQELVAHDEAWLAQPPPDPARKILFGLDDVRSLQKWLVGSEVLYVVRIERGDETRIQYVRIQIKSDVLSGIARVRLNPPPGPAGEEKSLDIFDPGQETYDLPVVGWSGEGSPAADGTPASETLGESSPETRKLKSDAVLAWMGLYDEAGLLESARYTLLPEAFLRSGLLALCEIAASIHVEGATAPEMTPEQAAKLEASSFAIRCLGRVVAESQVARPIVRGVIPGFDLLLMMLFKPRFTHTLRGAGIELHGDELPTIEKYGPACSLELDVNVDDRPKIRCYVTVALPRSPIDVCAGVIAIQCAHLDDPSRRVSVQLLAARRPKEAAGTPAFVARTVDTTVIDKRDAEPGSNLNVHREE